MRGIGLGALVGLLGWLGGEVSEAADPAAGNPPAVTLGRPVPAVQLERPVPLEGSAHIPSVLSRWSDSPLVAASYSGAEGSSPPAIVRAQAPDFGAPPPPTPAPGSTIVPPPGAPPGIAPAPLPGAAPGFPTGADERYNCGVVTTAPTSSHPWLDKICHPFKDLQCPDLGLGKLNFHGDHGFDFFSSPVTNPFLAEDPRALTEIKPIFITQGTPTSNFVFHGGDIEYFGLQARLAVTERLSFVLTELGLDWIEPHNPVDGFGPSVGFAEIRLGPKYTFYRCEQTGTIAAAGVNFDIASGDSRVFQNTGTLSVEPYISVGQKFGYSSFGTFNVMNILGYSFATDNQRTDFFFDSIHLDYDVANIHRIYPFMEFNYFHYESAGNQHPLGFEGRDLFNFGAAGVSGNNSSSLAFGVNYKFSECWQVGAAYEFPLGGHRDLMDYRVTFNLIWRF
jgi:hypothetical protein